MKIKDESVFELTARDIADLIDEKLQQLGYKRLTMNSDIFALSKKIKVIRGTALKIEDKSKVLN